MLVRSKYFNMIILSPILNMLAIFIHFSKFFLQDTVEEIFSY